MGRDMGRRSGVDTIPARKGVMVTRVDLNPVQWEFVTTGARFSLYIGGIGAGKSFAGAVRAIERAMSHPRSLGLVGAPTYTMLRDATQRTFFELLPRELIANFSQSRRHLALVNGSEVLFRSLDEPDRARGMNLAWYWLDEAPLCGHYAWQVLKGRLRQRGFETAAWATGTPRGRDGYWRDFEATPLPGHALFRASTYANAHNLPPGYIAEMGYAEGFARQEIYGLFVAFEGLVYTFDASPQGHLREHPSLMNRSSPAAGAETGPSVGGAAQPLLASPVPPPASAGGVGEASSFADVVGGVDWGYTNPAAAVVFGIDGDGRAWQLDEFYRRRAALDDTLLPALVDLTRRYAVRRWYCGPDEPEHITALAAAFARARLPALALRADNAVRAGIQTVTGLLARREDGTRGLYVAPRCVHTIAEYGSYAYATADASRRDPSEQPLKQNDHALDATRYALHSALGRARNTDAYLANLHQRIAVRDT